MYLGISKDDVRDLAEKFSIYIPLSGRISVSGIDSKNQPILIEAIKYLNEKKKN